jgi:deoxyribodipyrimidine photolyase
MADGNGPRDAVVMRPLISGIFNPYLQTQKFDPEFEYIKKWVPEFRELTYPQANNSS